MKTKWTGSTRRERADLATCINDFAIPDVHEVEMALSNALIMKLSPHVFIFLNHLSYHSVKHDPCKQDIVKTAEELLFLSTAQAATKECMAICRTAAI